MLYRLCLGYGLILGDFSYFKTEDPETLSVSLFFLDVLLRIS